MFQPKRAEAEWSTKEKTMLERHAKEFESDTASNQTSTDPTPTPINEDAAKPQMTAKEKALAKKAKKRQNLREKERARVEAIEEGQ